MRKPSNDCLVLFSGGMDSTISLYDRLVVARSQGSKVHVLSIDYGQRHDNELHAANRIIGFIRADERYRGVMGKAIKIAIPFPAIGSLTGGEPVTMYDDISDAQFNGDLDNSFVPYRNLIFLSVAAAHAYELGCGVISTGLRGGFPDCTEDFERHVQALLNVAVPDYPILIRTPTHMSRLECLELADRLPGCTDALALSVTCFNGGDEPCGHCLPCLKRAEGFALRRSTDPADTWREGHKGGRPHRDT